jgi:cellulose synthase/poly-beta-1,6-N-acetylglucosamine synthase-like glycosyltransferase
MPMSKFTILRAHRWNRPAAAPVARPAVVTIPVRNEEKGLAGCLEALAAMDSRTRALTDVLLVLNGCTDDTWRVGRKWRASTELPLSLVEVALSPSMDHAGGARACALTLALNGLDRTQGGVVLTTDADSRVGRDWLVRACAALDAGADVVAGEVVMERGLLRWPLPLQWRHNIESEYSALLDEIDALCDPVPHNPWPAHRRCSGANLAFRADALRSLPFIPAPRCGEDRAIVDACVARDLRVRHDPAVLVETSARLDGRAWGGMADTLRQRINQRDLPCDPLLEPCAQHVYRASTRAAARRTFASGMSDRALATALGLTAHGLTGTACHHFGEAWRSLEQHVPSLSRAALRPADLAWEIGEARACLAARLPDLHAGVAA